MSGVAICHRDPVSNHAHRRPQGELPEPAPRGWFRRLFARRSTGSERPAAVAGYATSRIDAELMAGYLRSQGVHAVVAADDEGGQNPVFQTAFGVRVLVPARHHATARQLLRDRS
jgi:hypothetical protein